MVRCCICDETRTPVELTEFAPWPVRRCSRCGLIYLDDRADQGAFVDDAAGQLDADATEKTVEYWSFPEMYRKHQAVFDDFFAERLQRLRQHQPNLKTVLDVGCGFGFFMHYLQEHGLETVGLDIEPQSVLYAHKELHLDVTHISFEEFTCTRTFDAIVACDVLEHVEHPPVFLTKCRRLLNPDGVLYIQVPNVLGDVLPPDGSYNWPYHLWQFAPDTLAALLEQNRFQPQQWWTGVMGVIGVYEAGGPDEAARDMWRRAETEKRGNRLQMIATPTREGNHS